MVLLVLSCTTCILQILRKLEEREADLDRLVEMEEKDIGSLIRFHPGGKVTVYFILYMHIS